MSGVGALTDALRFTVPLHIAELRGRHIPAWLTREQVLTAIMARAAGEFGPRGDQLMFTPKSPASYRAARVAGVSLSKGIAAAALLNPDTGVEVFGAHFCAAPHPGCPLSPPAPGSSKGERARKAHELLNQYEALLLGRDHTRQLRQPTPKEKGAA